MNTSMERHAAKCNNGHKRHPNGRKDRWKTIYGSTE